MRTCNTLLSLCCLNAIVLSQVVSLPEESPRPQDLPRAIQLTLKPQQTPVPSLRYRLHIPPLERKGGNAAAMYIEALENMPPLPRLNINDLLSMSPAELPQEEVAQVLSAYGNVLSQIKLGSTCEIVQWPAPDGGSPDFLDLHYGSLRHIARILSLEARLAMARGDFDTAVSAIRTCLALNRHIAKHTAIGWLVAAAMDSLMLDDIQQLIANGGPNMYWALAQLGTSLVDLRQALENEQSLLVAHSPHLQKAMVEPIGPEDALKVLEAVMAMLVDAVPENMLPPGFDNASAAGLVVMHYGNAKSILVERGRSVNEVDAMSPAQAVATYMVEDYIYWRDELLKWSHLPWWLGQDGLWRSQQDYEDYMINLRVINPFLILMLSRQYRVQLNHVRAERLKAALQTIESLRDHVARHGAPPASLDDLALPPPVDPITGKLFEYEVTGEAITLLGPAPEGEDQSSGLYYVVRFAPLDTETRQSEPDKTVAAGPEISGPWKGIGPFVHDEVFTILRLDVEAFLSDDAWRQVSQFVNKSIGEGVLGEIAPMRAVVQEHVKMGIKEVYLMTSASDIFDMPIIVVPLDEDDSFERLSGMLSGLCNGRGIHRMGGALVIASDWQRRSLLKPRSADPGRFARLFDSSTPPLRLAIVPSKDLRLLADLLPDLVAPLEGFDGKALAKLAEGLCCMMLDVTVLPEVSIRLTVDLADGDTAAGALSFIDSSMVLFLKSLSECVGITTPPAVDAPKATCSDKTVVLHLDERKLTELIRGCVMPALQKARLQALAAISLSEMRATITSITCYMADHEGQWPASLQAVAVDEQMLKQTAAFDRYVYLRPNVTCEELKNPSQQILVYDPVDEFGEGIAVGFVDGHVERITDEASLQELLSASLEQATRVGGPASE